MATEWQPGGSVQPVRAGNSTLWMGQKYPYELPHLSKVGGETDAERLAKQWVVDYRVWSERKGKLVRKREVINGATVAERTANARKSIQEITKILKKGVCVDPLHQPEPEVVNVAAVLPISIHTPLCEAFEHFLKVKGGEIKKNSVRTYKGAGEYLADFLKASGVPSLSIARFNAARAVQFGEWLKTAKGIENKTFNARVGTVRGFFNYLKTEARLIKENPFEEVKKKKEKRGGQHRPFSPDQIETLRLLCLTELKDVQLWAFCSFIYYTFARPHQEVRLLRVSDLRTKTITISAENAKGSAIRHVPIAPGLESVIGDLHLREAPGHYYVFGSEGKPGPQVKSDSSFYGRHVTLLKKAGLFGFDYDLYGWKHTGVCALYRASKDILLINRICGHTTLDQTHTYLRDLGLVAETLDVSGFPPL